MRVWLLPSSFAPHRGGVEEATFHLAQQLQQRGDDVLVVTNRWPHQLPAREVVDGVDVVRIVFRLPAARPAAVVDYLRARSAALRALDALGPPPDVLHVHCASSQLPTAAAYARRHAVPLVLSTHGETEMDAHGLYRSSAFMRWALRREAERAVAVTACSAWTASAAARVAPAFEGATVVLNGVSADFFQVPPVPPGPVVAAWGRHVTEKGFDLLLEAFGRVRAAVPGARLLLGGDGPETNRLSALAGDGVELVGRLDRAQVAGLLARSRVVVVPSRVEPFGLVAVEALAAGRGLVYASGTGLTEAAGGLGRAVDVRDPADLAAGVAAELREPTDPEAGRAWARTLDWPRVAARYRALYPGGR